MLYVASEVLSKSTVCKPLVTHRKRVKDTHFKILKQSSNMLKQLSLCSTAGARRILVLDTIVPELSNMRKSSREGSLKALFTAVANTTEEYSEEILAYDFFVENCAEEATTKATHGELYMKQVIEIAQLPDRTPAWEAAKLRCQEVMPLLSSRMSVSCLAPMMRKTDPEQVVADSNIRNTLLETLTTAIRTTDGSDLKAMSTDAERIITGLFRGALAKLTECGFTENIWPTLNELYEKLILCIEDDKRKGVTDVAKFIDRSTDSFLMFQKYKMIDDIDERTKADYPRGDSLKKMFGLGVSLKTGAPSRTLDLELAPIIQLGTEIHNFCIDDAKAHLGLMKQEVEAILDAHYDAKDLKSMPLLAVLGGGSQSGEVWSQDVEEQDGWLKIRKAASKFLIKLNVKEFSAAISLYEVKVQKATRCTIPIC